MNFYKLYIGDYQRDTAHLSIAEHGAYMLMLQHYYATERPLPTGKALHRMLRAQDKTEREAIDAVAAQFWRTTDEGLVNERADEEITKAGVQASANRVTAQAREAARKAAREQHESCSVRATNDDTKQPPRARNHSQTPDSIAVAELRQGERPPQAAARATRLPGDWSPGDDGTAFAEGLGLVNGRCAAELAKFRDYWAAKSGKDATKADWQATWRNWVRRSVEGGGTSAAALAAKPSKHAGFASKDYRTGVEADGTFA